MTTLILVLIIAIVLFIILGYFRLSSKIILKKPLSFVLSLLMFWECPLLRIYYIDGIIE